MTLLIKNVRILGSDRGPEVKGDVFVSAGAISAIGTFPHKGADETIDGQGGYLAPGFIDIDNTSDHYLGLFDAPDQEDFLKQGVTTIIGGHCGASLAPLLYGSLESLRKWADLDTINVDWHTMAEFFDRLARRPLGVNFATLAGHTTVRRALLGEDVRDLTKNELAVMEKVMQRALAEGAAGISTGLEYVHSRGTAYPELLALAKLARAADTVYSTHLRSTGAGMAAAMQETVKLHKESGASTLVTHFVPVLGLRDEYYKAMTYLDALDAGADFHIDTHPFGGSMVPFYRLLPEWARSGTLDVMAKGVRDPWLAKRIVKELPELGPEALVIAEAPQHNPLVGETLGSFMQMYETADPREALLKLLQITGLVGVAYIENVDRELADALLAHPRALIASHAPSVAGHSNRKLFRSPRATATFPEYLRRVTQKGLLDLSAAAARVTAAPAKKFHLANRGAVREGYVADLAVLDHDLNVKATVVNGSVAMRDGALTGARRGKPLLHISP